MKSRVVTLYSLQRKLSRITDTLHDDRVTVYAAQTAFYICISAIPFVMLVILLSKLVSPLPIAEIIPAVSAVMPEGAYEVLDYIYTQAMQVSDIPVISTAAVGALWSASRGMRAIMRGVSEVYKVSVRGTFISGIFRSLIYTFLFSAIIILTLLFTALGGVVAGGEILERYGASFVLRLFLYVVFLALYFSLLYYVVARGGLFLKGRRGESSECPKCYVMQLPGAFLAAGGWILFSYFYSLYIRFFPRSSYVYGGLGAVVLLMLWLYFCIFIILLGAEVNVFVHLYRKRKMSIKG